MVKNKVVAKKSAPKKVATKKATVKKVVTTVDPKRSAAAKKAWKTIRSNQRKNKS